MKKILNTIDQITTFISGSMCAVMMIILIINIILRYIPGIGGFSWYMEGSQYMNVWSMLIVGIGISATRTHLKVALIDDMAMKAGPVFFKIQQGFVALAIIVFYLAVTYSGYLYASKSNQLISTMPIFKMSLIYWMFPITGILCAASAAMDYIVFLTDKGGEEA